MFYHILIESNFVCRSLKLAWLPAISQEGTTTYVGMCDNTLMGYANSVEKTTLLAWIQIVITFTLGYTLDEYRLGNQIL